MKWASSKVEWIIVISSLILFGQMLVTTGSYSQTPGWSTPILLSPPDSTGWFPDVAVDALGQIHVVWSSWIEIQKNEKYDAVFYTTSQDGQTWREVVDIAAPELSFGEATRPTLFADQKGTLHISYRGTNVYYSHAPIQTAYSVTSWLSPSQMNVSQVAYFSRLTADSGGRLHLIFTENVLTPDCPICYRIFHRQSDDNGLSWSNITEISTVPTGAAKPQILVDGKDNLHVVWEAGVGGSYGQLQDPTAVMYSASYDRGQTWTFPIAFVVPGEQAKNVTIGLDGDGKLIVAWLEKPDNLIYYQFSQDQGRSWSSPRSIPGVWGGSVTPLDDFSMAADSAGNVHLALVGRTTQEQESLSVLHLTWDGSSWSRPEIITTLTGDVPEWPRIAIGNGNQLHTVWFVRDEEHVWDSDNQQYQIWYAQGSSSAPPVKLVIQPSPTPSLEPTKVNTPTVTPKSRQTPTPVSLSNPDLKQNPVPVGATESVYTESDELFLLLKSLIPTALIIVVVIVIVRLWRS